MDLRGRSTVVLGFLINFSARENGFASATIELHPSCSCYDASLIRRLLDEERFLASHLAGYSDYQTKVGFRLILSYGDLAARRDLEKPPKELPTP